jgi:creatinine amidohydrolase
LPAAVIEPLLVALFEQFAAMGFRTIVAFTGHFGREHTLVLKRAAVSVMQRTEVTIVPLTPYDLVTDLWQGDHAGPGETSLLWALEPKLVRLDAVAAGDPLPGVIGDDPRGRASQEWGAHLLDQIAGRSAALALVLHEATASRRALYLAALETMVRVLEVIQEARTTRPAPEVPELLAPAYVSALQALARGDFASARDQAARRLAEIT